MVRIIDLGSLPPDHKIFTGGFTIGSHLGSKKPETVFRDDTDGETPEPQPGVFLSPEENESKEQFKERAKAALRKAGLLKDKPE